MSHPIADKLPIGVTMGDAAGIGPEIIAKAHSEHADVMRGSFVVGDVDTMRRASRLVALNGRPALPVAVITDPAQVIDVPPHCIAVLQVGAALLPVPWAKSVPMRVCWRVVASSGLRMRRWRARFLQW